MIREPLDASRLPQDLQDLITPPLPPLLTREQVEQPLNWVDGNPTPDRQRLSHIIFLLKRIQDAVLPILMVSLIGYSGILASILPHAFTAICLQSTAPLLTLFITCMTVAALFDCYLRKTMPTHDDYLLHLARQTPEIAKELTGLMQDRDAHLGEAHEVEEGYYLYLANLALQELRRSPERALHLARHIYRVEIATPCIATIQPLYDAFARDQVILSLAQNDRDPVYLASIWTFSMSDLAKNEVEGLIEPVRNARLASLLLNNLAFGNTQYALDAVQHIARQENQELKRACLQIITQYTPITTQMNLHLKKGQFDPRAALKVVEQMDHSELQVECYKRIDRKISNYIKRHLVDNASITPDDFAGLSQYALLIRSQEKRGARIAQLEEAHDNWLIEQVDQLLRPGFGYNPQKALEHVNNMKMEKQAAQIARISASQPAYL